MLREFFENGLIKDDLRGKGKMPVRRERGQWEIFRSVLLSSSIVATPALSRYHITLAEQANANAMQDTKRAQLNQSQRDGNNNYNCLQNCFV